MSKIQKPITVVREEFIRNISDLINNAGLPPFIIEPIIKDIHNEVKTAAEMQYRKDLDEYNKNSK